MSTAERVITILVAVLATVSTRALPFLLFKSGRRVPPFVDYLAKVLPASVIGLLVVFALRTVPSSIHHGIPEALALCFIAILYRIKKNSLLCIAGGTVLYMILLQYVF